MALPPKKIGPYQVVHLIGEGGLSDVYLTLKEGTPYALKCLKPERANIKRHLDDFIREVKIASTLKHPNILGFSDDGKSEETYFGVMEPVVGITAHQLIVESKKQLGRVPVSVALFVLRETLKALSYLHRTTVFENSNSFTFHGDLSPANILISQDGRVLLTDFGSAGQNTSADPQETHLGKMYYLPSDVLDRGAVTTTTDVYSMGVIAFYLLFGERPFEAKEKHELYRIIGQQEVPRLDCSNITRNRKDDGPLRIFFNQALNKDKELRFKTSQEFYDALFAIHFAEDVPMTRLDFLNQLNRIQPNLFTKVATDWKERIELHRTQEFKTTRSNKSGPVESLLARVDKRRHPRIATDDLQLNAEILSVEHNIRLNVPIVELSQGGMLVKWEGLLPKVGKDYPIKMQIGTKEEPIQTTGRLLYEVHRQTRPHAAFQFMNITPTQEEMIKGFVSQRMGKATFSEKVASLKEETTSEDFLEVYFRGVGEFKEEFDKNIRHAGMYIQSSQFFPVDSEILVRIQVANQLGRAVLKGRVVQCQPLDKAKIHENFGLGIQLSETPEQIKSQLEQYFDLKL